ncbi:MAG: TolB family protein [Planctomycetota bacterium]
MRTPSIKLILFLVLCTLGLAGLSKAMLLPGFIHQLSDNDVDDTGLAVSGGNAVWQAADANGDQEIFLFMDGDTVGSQLTANVMDDINPTISGMDVAWQSWDGNDWEIYAYNGFAITQITDNDANDVNPQISGMLIFWEGNDGNDVEIFATRLPPRPVEMSFRIMPRSLNLKSRGRWVTCTLRLPKDISAAGIDPDSILLQGSIPPDWMKVSTRYNKILLKFSRSAFQALLSPGPAVEVTLTCTAADGTPIVCTDKIKVK